MLKIECCIKCWNLTDEWDESDEERWERGLVWCPCNYVKKGEKIIRSITEQPPSKCPYYLENIL